MNHLPILKMSSILARVATWSLVGLLTPATVFSTAAEDVITDAAEMPVSKQPSSTPGSWRESASCGVTSCLIMGKLAGLPLTYDQCRSAIPILDGGSNLLAMKNGCGRLGLQLEAISSTPKEIGSIRCPYVAHLYPSEASKFKAGHYIVVLSLSSTHVTFIEPNWAPSIEQVPRTDFLRAWSGNLLIRPDLQDTPTLHGSIVGWGTVAAGAAWFLFFLGYQFKSWKFARRQASPTLAVGALMLLILTVSQGCSESSASDGSDQTRASELFSLTAWKSEANVGAIANLEKAVAEFPIENTGSVPVDLEIGKPSCQCASATLSKPHIAAGETAILTMAMQNQGKGSFRSSNLIVTAKNHDWATAFTMKGLALGALFQPYDYHLVAGRPTLVRGTFYSREPNDIRIIKAYFKQHKQNGAGTTVPIVGEPMIQSPKAVSGYCLREVTIPVQLSKPAATQQNFTLVIEVDVKSSVQVHQCTLTATPQNG